MLANALVWDVDRDLNVSFAVGDTARRVRARCLVVATGSTDGVAPFQGWTLPGVVLLRETMAVLSGQGLSPGLRALVVGGGDAALTVTTGLLRSGAEAVTVACADPSISASRVLVEAAAAEGVDLLPGYRVSEALGEGVVERARIAPGRRFGRQDDRHGGGLDHTGHPSHPGFPGGIAAGRACILQGGDGRVGPADRSESEELGPSSIHRRRRVRGGQRGLGDIRRQGRRPHGGR